MAAHFVRFFGEAVRCPGASAVAHPFVANRDALGPLSFIWSHVDRPALRESLLEAAERSVAVELTPKALAPDYHGVLLELYGLARECGVRFLVGSDAHDLATIGATSRLQPLVDALGLSDADLWRPEPARARP